MFPSPNSGSTDMPALPWIKFFPQDWMSDPKLSRCCPATRGIWADAIFTMMLLGDFKLEGTDEELARQCRCSDEDVRNAHKDLERTNAADVLEHNGCKTWVCRKLKRANKIRASKVAAGHARWSKTDANAEQSNGDSAYARSASASASESVPGESTERGKTVRILREGVVSFYDRHPDEPWAYADEHLLVEISKRPGCLEELADLRNYERATQYFPKSINRLLTDWPRHLDAARASKRDQGKGKPKSLPSKEADKLLKMAQDL